MRLYESVFIARQDVSAQHVEALTKDLRVMDATAISLARENDIPILVFSVKESGNFAKAVTGVGEFTVVKNEV